MPELILVRHGETDSNKRGTFCGWTDVGLTGNGILQAEAAAQRLATIVPDKPEAIYASPLLRTRQTAEIINRDYHMEIRYRDAIKERHFGAWEDLTYEEIGVKFPQEKLLWEKDWANYCTEGGESAVQVFSRVKEFMAGLLRQHTRGKVIVVTHLGCIQAALADLLGMPEEGVWRFRVDNCGISRIKVNDEGYAYLTGLNL